MWSGEGAGGRKLILPSEESVFVYLRVYFLSSITCSFNNSILEHGTPHQLGLHFNSTYSLYFAKVNSSGGFTFNLHTGFEEDYDDYQIYDIDRATYDEDVLNSWLLGAASVALGIFSGYKIKQMTRERENLE